MDNEGAILFFNPFYFKNGNVSKPKYFIVLKALNGTTILASLPSSIDFRPTTDATSHGCVELPEARFNCYVFEAQRLVTTKGWAFPLNTFVYGQQIDEYELSVLKDIYPVEGLDYKIVGTLLTGEFQRMKDCFLKSASVKRKFRKMLSDTAT